MLTQPIKEKIKQLFIDTPENVGVSFGNKKVNNKNIGERSIVFLVDKKKPISELLPEEILPTNVEVDGYNYKTDVVEIGQIKALCDQITLGQCFNWQPAGTTIPPNRDLQRPIQGGISLSTKNNEPPT